METSTKQQQQQQQQQFIYSNRKATNNNNIKYNNNNNNNNISDFNNNYENNRYIYDQQDKLKMVDNKTNKSNSAAPITNALSPSNNSNNTKHEFIKSIKLIEKQIQSNTNLNQKQQQQHQQNQHQHQLQHQQSLSDEKINDENRVQPIWTKFNYDPDTSIYLIKREKIEKFIQVKGYLAIAQRTKCKIQLYLNNDISGTVYFTVSGTYESRCNALEQLRDETGKAGVIVNLPSLTKPNSILKKPSTTTTTTSTSPRAHLNLKFNSYEDYDGDTSINKTSNNNKKNAATTPTAAPTASKTVSFKRTKSFHNKLSTTINNDHQTTQQPQPQQQHQLPSQQFLSELANRRMYTQQISNSSTTSSASTSPSSLSSSNSTSPTSFQQQYSTIDTIIQQDSTKQNQQQQPQQLQQQQQKLSDKNSNTQTKPTTTTTTPGSTKHRYTLDFLLLRADDTQSKELPKNWPELNNKYPNICFCGRVISYFNPHKYQAYWDKIKQLNQHLHVSTQ